MYISEELRAIPPAFDYGAFELPANVALDFRLSPHGSPADLPPNSVLKQEIRSSDAVVVEAIVAGVDPVRTLGKISQGDFRSFQRWRQLFASGDVQFGEWAGAMFGAVYNSRVPATVVDISGQDPIARKLDSALDRYASVARHSRTDGDVLKVSGKLYDSFDQFKARDQKILGNFAPRLAELALRSKLLRHKQDDGPALVGVYYGTSHRSLHDAFAHKNSIGPAQGFSVRIAEGSVATNLTEAMYAQYLRTGEVDPALIVRDAAQKLISGVLVARKHVPRTTSMYTLETAALRLIDGMDYSGAYELARDLRAEPLGSLRSIFDTTEKEHA